MQIHSKMARLDGEAREWNAEIKQWLNEGNRKWLKPELFQEEWAAKLKQMEYQYGLVDKAGNRLKGKLVTEADWMAYDTWSKGDTCRTLFRNQNRVKPWNPSNEEKARAFADAKKFGRVSKGKVFLTNVFVFLSIKDAIELSGVAKPPDVVVEGSYYFVDSDNSVFVVKKSNWQRLEFDPKIIYVAGPKEGKEEIITEEDVTFWETAAEALYGRYESPAPWNGFRARFYPGLERKTLPIIDPETNYESGWIDESGKHYNNPTDGLGRSRYD